MGSPERARPNRIRKRWDEGRSAIVGWLSSPSLLAAEVLACSGVDGIVIDLQHGSADPGAITPIMAAIEAHGVEPIVRPLTDNGACIGKLLDLGAYGIIAPMISSVAAAADFARAVHYPPLGARSFGPRRPLLRFGSNYFSIAASTVVTLAMIETRTALGCLDEILAVDGLDGVFVGPADLTLSLGYHPVRETSCELVSDAVEHIRRTAQRSGKRAGIFCPSTAIAKQRLSEGFDLVTLAPDLTMISAASQEAMAELRK